MTAKLLAAVPVALACLAWGAQANRLSQATTPVEDVHMPQGLLRRPVALALAADGRWLFVANRQAGSIGIVDTETARLQGEKAVGQRLADLAVCGQGSLLAVDEAAGTLLVLRQRGPEIEVADRVQVSPFPVSVQPLPGGRGCSVASLWSRQLTFVDLGKPARVRRTVDLPFAPRRQLLVPGGAKLLVADAFGGRLGVVDVASGKLETVRSLPAHNIRGLALDAAGKRLYLTHQILNPLANASRDNIHWGNLLTNNVRILVLAHVLDARVDVLRDSVLLQLGDVGRGAADPAGLAVLSDGRILVTLAGVHELALGREPFADWDRVPVGRGAVAVLPSADGQRAFVANHFSDSLSVLDLAKRRVAAEIALGPPGSGEAVDRGDQLFHDGRLAHDGWLSCHSCHPDGHTIGLLSDNLSDGSYGTPKRILSLLGARDTAPYAWNGGMKTLEVQVQSSIERTMHGPKPTSQQVADIAAFLRTLPPVPSLARLRGSQTDAAVRHGAILFREQHCVNCHTPPTFTSARTEYVGLRDEAGNDHFNPPSLRGVSQGGPYFHDNRAASLDEVLRRYRHQLRSELGAADLRDLEAYLNSL
jgi:YVTN family beta-propeller protein